MLESTTMASSATEPSVAPEAASLADSASPSAAVPATAKSGLTATRTTNVVKEGERKRYIAPQIPADILDNEALNEAIKALPSNYSFEIHKTLWRLRVTNAKRVALQFPEGLLLYACTICNILERFGRVETVIMGDVTYGACCIDDFTAKALDCDFLVHYGHSCLVPIDVSQMNTLYVFVDISFQTAHLVSMLKANFPSDCRLIIAGTIQFTSAMQAARRALTEAFPNILIPQCMPLSQGEVLGCTSPHLPSLYPVVKPATDTPTTTNIPTTTNTSATTSNPEETSAAAATTTTTTAAATSTLSSCCSDAKKEQGSCCGSNASSSLSSSCCSTSSSSTTSSCCSTLSSSSTPSSSSSSSSPSSSSSLPALPAGTNADVCVFIADGRFHLESLMIHNPQISEFYKYDPYNKMLTSESYDHKTMHSVRKEAVDAACKAKTWGVVLGTLGRQGSTDILARIESSLTARGLNYIVVLLSEIFPAKLATMDSVDAWVQIACPRLSIDWGYAFEKPLLSPYEFEVAMEQASWLPNGVYPMDFYSHTGGTWTNYHESRRKAKVGRTTATAQSNRVGRSAAARAAAKAAAAAVAGGGAVGDCGSNVTVTGVTAAGGGNSDVPSCSERQQQLPRGTIQLEVD